MGGLMCPADTSRRGLLLVVVLTVIAVMSVMAASFAYMMNADLAAVSAMQARQQARLAAESGIARAVLLLRDHRTEIDQWYDNKEAFQRVLVWAPGRIGGSESLADKEKVEGQQAWRYSAMATEKQGDKTRIRYGLTGEASKLNPLSVSRGQLIRFFDQFEFEKATSMELADALIDWQDEDDALVSPSGAESSYYMTLEPRYRCKNRPLQTVEELLMVKGFTGQVLYGEDTNRNGYLDENEDDGPEGAFPPDDGDGVLDQGIYPFLTVYSWDFNSANDNKPRLSINLVDFSKRESLPEYVVEEINPDVLDFIAEARKRKYKFRSVGELLNLQVYEDGSSNYDEAWAALAREAKQANNTGLSDDTAESAPSEGAESGAEDTTGGDDTGGTDDGLSDEERDKLQEELDQLDEGSREKDRKRRQQAVGEGADEEASGGQEDTSERRGRRDRRDRFSRDGRTGSREGRPGRRAGTGTTGGTGGSTTGGTTGGKSRGTPIISPVTAEQMAVLMDRLTVVTSPVQRGLIDVNTAPVEVLASIPGLTEEQANTIVDRRVQVAAEDKTTPAWLVSFGVLEPTTFALVCNALTARSLQFHIDMVGFADHEDVACRIQAVVEMKGHLSQIKYHRDITLLGLGYPLVEEERTEGFKSNDR